MSGLTDRMLDHPLHGLIADEFAARYCGAFPESAADVMARYDAQAARLAAGAELVETAWSAGDVGSTEEEPATQTGATR